ncbi:hypothetical protein T484DRAFT_1916005 [Baffinella frigidus]|nr:hypothetical protein T484DRAFT_1916005 [Cryptophyta sp. CCMP2293]
MKVDDSQASGGVTRQHLSSASLPLPLHAGHNHALPQPLRRAPGLQPGGEPSLLAKAVLSPMMLDLCNNMPPPRRGRFLVSQLPLYTAVAHRGNGRTGHMYTPCLAPTARGDALPRGGSGEGGGSENAASFAPLSAPAEATMVSAELDLKLSRRGARSSATAVLCWHQRLVVSSVLGQRQLDAESSSPAMDPR